MAKSLKVFIAAIMILVIGAGCATQKNSVKMDKAPVAPQAVQPGIVLKTPTDKMSYSYGVEIAKGLKRQGINFNADAVAQGMKDVESDKVLMSTEELRTNVAAFQSEVRTKQARARLMTGLDNKKAGDEFMAANKLKAGVITLPNGLQYKILKTGTGPKPTNDDTVECWYRGTLIDGTEFDSSVQPDNENGLSIFKVSEVIPGWREALKLMPVGSRWHLFVPPSLAYGQRGTGRVIGPYATLIFEVELVAIK